MPVDGLPSSGRSSSRRRFGAGLAGALALVGLGLVPSRSTPSARAATLTPQQHAGPRVVYSYPGLTPPTSLFRHISNGEATGVISFGENISGDAQIASVIQQLRQAQQQSPIQAPLLLMTDQEGGLV
jgi:beta-N-acetylhexosaminidase